MYQKVLFVFVFILSGYFTFAQGLENYYTKKIKSDLAIAAEYPSGPEAFYSFIEQNFRINKSTTNDVGNALITAVISFNIDTMGQHSNYIYRETIPLNVELAMTQTLRQMPNWKPAIFNENKVPSTKFVTMRFVIAEGQLIMQNQGALAVVGRSKKNRLLKIILIGAAVVVLFLFVGRQI